MAFKEKASGDGEPAQMHAPDMRPDAVHAQQANPFQGKPRPEMDVRASQQKALDSLAGLMKHAQAIGPGASGGKMSGAKSGKAHYAKAYDSVSLSASQKAMAEKISDLYYERTGQRTLITQGIRTIRTEAEDMHAAIRSNHGRVSQFCVNPNSKVAQTLEKMGEVVRSGGSVKDVERIISAACADGSYFSHSHIQGEALDIRSKNMSPGQKAEFVRSAEDAGYYPFHESPGGQNEHFHVRPRRPGDRKLSE
jgi:hypothetical protein